MEVVSFEIAKKLKEKGFREKCLLHYESNGGFYSNSINTYDRPNQELDYSDFLKCFNEGNSIGLIDTPTISQVLKWLREECGIFIIVEPDILSPGYKLTFTPRVKFYIKGEEDEGFSEYLTYRRDSHELAALAGIEYVIDNLI